MTDRTICYCVGVVESQIVQAVHDGARSISDIQKRTGACTGNRCSDLNPHGECCSADINEIIERETGLSPVSECGCCQ